MGETTIKNIVIFLLITTFAFAYTSGSGTIQNCQNLSYDYCNVTVSSSITGSDFVLNNRQTIIFPGVSITVLRSRLFINSTELIWLESGASIMANGKYRNSPDPDGGTGGSNLAVYSGWGTHGLGGAFNGSNGLQASYGAVYIVDAGEGSNKPPFYFPPGAAGIYSGSPDGATGGGFYATGGCFGDGDGAGTECWTGGAGHPIKLKAAKIQIDGKVYNSAADSAVVGGGASNGKVAAGGSGAGEILLYAATLNLTGSIFLLGGKGIVARPVGSVSPVYANGGAGGQYLACTRLNNYSTGNVTLTGGICSSLNAVCTNGVDGNATYNTNSTCFDDLIVHLYTQNASLVNSTNPLQFKVGVFNSSNVTCWQTLNGTSTPIGIFNLTSEVVTYNLTTPTTGTYLINITCGNASAGIANVTSETITITTYSVPIPVPECTIDSDCASGYVCTGGTCVASGGGGGGGGGGGTTPPVNPTPEVPPAPEPTPQPETPPATPTFDQIISGGWGVGNSDVPVAATILKNAFPDFITESYSKCAVRKVGPLEMFTCEYTGLAGLVFFDFFSAALIFLILFTVAILYFAERLIRKRSLISIPALGTSAIMAFLTIVVVAANNLIIVNLARWVS